MQPSAVLPSPVPIHHGPTILLNEALILLLDLEFFLLGELLPCFGALLKVAVHGREVTLLEVMNHLGLCRSHDLGGWAGVGTTTQPPAPLYLCSVLSPTPGSTQYRTNY